MSILLDDPIRKSRLAFSTATRVGIWSIFLAQIDRWTRLHLRKRAIGVVGWRSRRRTVDKGWPLKPYDSDVDLPNSSFEMPRIGT